jgi:lipopolysaccharide biosynthesis regulator YciM
LRRALHAVLDHDLEVAEQLLGDAVRHDSNEVDGYLALARVFRQRGEIGRAIHLHQNLLLRRDLEPEARERALLGLAEDFREGGFLRRAIAAYEEVLARHPRDPRALRALVRLFLGVREPRRAIPLARRLIRVEGESAKSLETDAWIELAEVERGEGRTHAARKALERAARGDAGCVRAWIALGEVEAELGRSRQALAAWRRVPEIDRRAGPQVYARTAATFAALGRARDQEVWLRELIAADPNDPGARIALARALGARGAWEEALALLDELGEREPDRLDAQVARSRILLAAGKDEPARAAHAALLDLLERAPVPSPWLGGDTLA